MKRIPSIFLRITIVVLGLLALAVCTVALPLLWGDVTKEFPEYAYAVYAVFVAFYTAAVPFLIGLYNAWRLLDFIDKGGAFTKPTVKALSGIAICAAVASGVFLLSMPFFYIWGDLDDAPGLIVIGMVFVSAPLVVSLFAAILQRLISEAVELKSENELTV